jgi:hypothetical protein
MRQWRILGKSRYKVLLETPNSFAAVAIRMCGSTECPMDTGADTGRKLFVLFGFFIGFLLLLIVHEAVSAVLCSNRRAGNKKAANFGRSVLSDRRLDVAM